MHNLIKILIVEDEMIIGAKISMQLTALGYEVTGILPRGEEVLNHVKENKPDIILLDIHLKGKMSGKTDDLIFGIIMMLIITPLASIWFICFWKICFTG